MQPLTHHEIVALVEPLTRSGRQVDLAACQRLERRVAFRPVAHPAQGAGRPACTEAWHLDAADARALRLTRRLTWDNGLQAELQAQGESLADLVARMDAVARERHYRSGAGYAIAHSHRWPVGATGPAAAPGAAARLEYTHGVALIDGLTVRLKASTVRGYAADVEVAAPPGDTIELPEDLLAVLGWDWSRLDRSGGGWAARVRVRGAQPRRSQRAESALERVAVHLARTLAEPPGRFHERLYWARWTVALRRAMPLLVSAALVAAAAAVPKLPIAPDSAIRMMIFNAPPLLLVLCLAMRELPRFEIPPMPRADRAASWRAPRPSG